MYRLIAQKYENLKINQADAIELVKNYVLPINGAISYGLLGAHLMAPNWFGLGMCRRNASSLLLASTLLTSGVYLYERPQFAMLTRPMRGLFAFYGASMFSFGSMLCWGLVKTTLPTNENWLSIGLGFFTGAALTKISYDFIQYCEHFYLFTEGNEDAAAAADADVAAIDADAAGDADAVGDADADADAAGDGDEDEAEVEVEGNEDDKEDIKELTQNQGQEVSVELKRAGNF